MHGLVQAILLRKKTRFSNVVEMIVSFEYYLQNDGKRIIMTTRNENDYNDGSQIQFINCMMEERILRMHINFLFISE